MCEFDGEENRPLQSLRERFDFHPREENNFREEGGSFKRFSLFHWCSFLPHYTAARLFFLGASSAYWSHLTVLRTLL